MKGLNTKMLHGYPVIDGYTGAASIPKYQTSTFDQKSCYVDGKKYSYSRFVVMLSSQARCMAVPSSLLQRLCQG